MNKKVAGVIVMGGLNTRMNGVKKAFLDYNGKKFYEHICKSLANTNAIYLSVENVENYKDMEYELIEDLYKEIGPIGGIYSALKKCSEDAIFILPSDTPLVKKEMVDTLLDKYYELDTNIILSENGKVHPLIAIYKKDIVNIIKHNIDTGNYKVKDILKKIEYATVCIEDIDIDTLTINDFNDNDSYCKLIDGGV